MPPLEIVTPSELAPPRGYSHGAKGRGELLFVAGQIGWDAQQRLVSDDFAAQFGQALDNVLAVVHAAGGAPASIARLTLYVTDRTEYRARARDVGAIYRARMGRHYPAMTLVEVRSLLEDAAKVEIEATAVL
jgi:enamine deaminase RidA (YjgF/YER057c/UK114 family)